MGLNYAEPEHVTQLRRHLRHLCDELLPPSFTGAFSGDAESVDMAQAFCREMGKQGLLALAWPAEFGGLERPLAEQTAMREEMWAAHEPRGAQYMGANWVGPIIMRHGDPSQQRLHLPPIAAGEVVWCQGFSEPDAGSDLFALNTRATRTGSDGWSITGQKMWTSYAAMADWCFLLARTSPRSVGAQGISVFLVPMTAAGIEVRPIPNMLGVHHLNEVYLDDVHVPKSALLGVEGNGASIVRDVVALERVGVARYARCDKLLSGAPTAFGSMWEDMPSALHRRWALALLHTRETRLLAYRIVDQQGEGRLSPSAAASYRLAATALDQEVADVLLEMVGHASLDPAGDATGYTAQVVDHWTYSRASTVASGTSEMQRRALARAIGSRS